MKLGRKDYTISVKTGTDANKAKFKKECVQGEIYHATDTGFFYIAEVTAGASDATLSKFGAQAFANQYSVSFDGTDDYATATLGSQVFDGDFSISFWFNADTASTNTTLIQSGSNSSYNDGFRIYRYSSTALAFWKGQGGYSNIFGNIGTTATGSWHHIAVTRSGSTSTFYLNGSSIDTGTDSQSYTSTAFQMSFTTYPFDGLMDEVALWDSALTSSNVTAIYNSGVPNDLSVLSPVNWWRMGDINGASGVTITDQGSGGNDGTLTNGATFSTDVPVALFSRYSVSCDGTDDYMDVGTVSDLNGSISAVTLSAWINISSFGRAIMSGGSSGSDRFYLQAFNSTNFRYGSGSGFHDFTVPTISTSTWVHVGIVHNGTSATLYLNGVASSSGVQTVESPNANYGTAFKVGSYYTGSTYFPGLIDEVAVFNSALSSTNITAIYNSGVPNDISSLSPVGWWRMGDNDGATGTTITDQGSGGNNGTLTNGPTFSTTVPS